MLGTRVACPHCKTVLKSGKSLRPGKHITCVKCHRSFVVSEPHQDAAAAPTPALVAVPANGFSAPASPEPPLIRLRARPRGPMRAVLAFVALVVFVGGGVAAAIFFLRDDASESTDKAQARNSVPGAVTPDERAAARAPSENKAADPKENPGKKRTPAVAAPRHERKKNGLPEAPVSDAAIRPAVATLGDQEKINAAIAKGVAYLKKTIAARGTWLEEGEEHAVGYAALPALALLECNVPPNDPVIQQAVAFVREQAPALDKTYDLGCALLLLDRLGEARDKKLIRMLAGRLLAGQTAAGGWDYKCTRLAPADAEELLRYLHKHQPKPEFFNPLAGKDASKKSVTKKRPAKADEVSPRLRDLPLVVHQRGKLPAKSGRDDNSNTQFGLLGLWAARRHDVPVQLALELAAQRFRHTQRDNGAWGYVPREPTKNSMTCVGLLGLAMGHGAAAEAFLLAVKDKEAPLPSLEDPSIKAALAALAKYINRDDDAKGLESRTDLYYLWTLERVGMLYRQPRFGKIDWYRWGCDIILPKQRDDGSWQDHYGQAIDTTFALLFLRRSNLVRDLTDNLNLYLAIPRPEARPPGQ